jgi:hypothetical protein
LAFDSRKLHRDVGDGAMLLVANDAHNGAVVELEFGVAREVCCSKRRDASGNQRVEKGAPCGILVLAIIIIIIINHYLPWGAAAIAVATHLAWCARWTRRHRRILEPGA